MQGQRRAPVLSLLALVSAYVLWSIVFVCLYGGHGALCEGGRAGLAKPLLALGAGFLLALHAVLLWRMMAWRKRAGRDKILPHLAVLLAASALPASAWLFLPVLFLEPCV